MVCAGRSYALTPADKYTTTLGLVSRRAAHELDVLVHAPPVGPSRVQHLLSPDVGHSGLMDTVRSLTVHAFLLLLAPAFFLPLRLSVFRFGQAPFCLQFLRFVFMFLCFLRFCFVSAFFLCYPFSFTFLLCLVILWLPVFLPEAFLWLPFSSLRFRFLLSPGCSRVPLIGAWFAPDFPFLFYCALCAPFFISFFWRFVCRFSFPFLGTLVGIGVLSWLADWAASLTTNLVS